MTLRRRRLARIAFNRFAPPALEDEEKKHSRWRRIGVFGDLPTRLLMHGLKSAPWFLEPVLIPPWTLLFFLVAREQRRAVVGNLRALFPEWSAFRARAGAFRVFLNFAFTYVDALRCETGTGDVDWVIDGLEYFEDLRSRKEGCLILTAHMGNYDMAAPLFSSKFGRTVHAVRAPEREPEMQAIREAEQREKERLNPWFRTCFNTGGDMLGVELARYLNQGDVVAVQGDRVIFEVSPMEAEVEPGLHMRLPRGPLYLARITGAATFPLFIIREGWRRYRIQVHAPLQLPERIRGRGEDPATAVWAGAILDTVKSRWPQWFVFEPILRREKGRAA
jgi:lauroyl/myristoyl acyltransferase